MHHLEHYQFCIIVRFWGQSYTCTCMHLHFEVILWFSTQVVQILHAQFSPVLPMSWSVVIINMNWCGVSAKKSFCIYQSTTWLGRNRILVVLWTIIFLSKVKFCKSCLFVWEWLQNFSTWSHRLRIEKGCSGSLFSLFFKDVVDHLWIVFISVNHLILYSQRNTEKGVNSYSLLFVRVFKS